MTAGVLLLAGLAWWPRLRRAARGRRERLVGNDVQPNGPGVATDTVFLAEAEAIVDRDLGNPDFSIAEFAVAMGLSERHLQRKMRADAGCTPAEFVRNVRLRAAAGLLREGSSPIAEVAASVGFRDPSYFARVFRRAFGMSPSRYPDRSDSDTR